MASTLFAISIIVFRSQPLDLQQYRHTALWFRLSAGSAAVTHAEKFPSATAHVTGPPQMFELEVHHDWDPRNDELFAKEVVVTSVPTPHKTNDALTTGKENQPMQHECLTSRNKDISSGVFGSSKLETKGELLKLIYETTPRNWDPEFNCHGWVEMLLKRLVREGLISEEQYLISLDGMVEATMEAVDDAYDM